MATITLADLKSRALEVANMEGSSFVSTAELDYLVNDAVSEYHDVVSEVAMLDGPGYGLTSVTGAGVTATYTMPGDVYKVVNVLQTDKASPLQIRRLPNYLRDRVKANATSIDVTVEYLPTVTPLVNSGDVFTFIGDGDKFVINSVAARLLAKEESDPSIQQLMADRAIQRVRDMLPRHTFDAMQMVDDYARRFSAYWYRLTGPTTMELWEYHENLEILPYPWGWGWG